MGKMGTATNSLPAMALEKKALGLKRIGWLYPIFPLGKIARELVLLLCGVLLLSLPGRLPAQPTTEQIEFFESAIRPLLAEHCYQCHSQKANPVFAGLRLDSRSDLEKGSDSGPVVIPGKPEESRLVEVVRGTGALQMPPAGKLSADKIAALVKWIEMGAPWPDEKALLSAKPGSKFDLEARRSEHWAWQPVRAVASPRVENDAWVRNGIDAFVLAKLEEKGLRPAKQATPETLLRRLYFDLIGLPPSPEEVEAFIANSSQNAYQAVVDRLLASERFGERWARHWMDLVRYSESHGMEGDPDIPSAWQYRDYLIRAFNSDLPYDQLVREHIAGDLLETPRYNRRDEINESILGPAHFRMVEHAYLPLDPLEDRVKYTDNQIDVFSKVFQGLTVSCARCHDHKFDAISQKDFYALFGIFAGGRLAQITIDAPRRQSTHRERLAELKRRIKQGLVEAWLEAAESLPQALLSGEWTNRVPDETYCDDQSPLHAWFTLAEREGEQFRTGWDRLAAYWDRELERRRSLNAEGNKSVWKLDSDGYRGWLRHGPGLGDKPSAGGEFSLVPEGKRIISGVYPRGVYTHLLSRKHGGILSSPRFVVDTDHLSFRILGGNFSFARLIVENYPLPRNIIYDFRFSPKQDQMQWAGWDISYWKGSRAYLEFATLDDLTNFELDPLDKLKDPKPEPRRDGRSYFGVSQVVFHDGKQPPAEEIVPIRHLLDGEAPEGPEELAARISLRLQDAIRAWRHGRLAEQQAAFLDDFVRKGLLPNSLGELASLRSLVAEYRKLEADIPLPRRAPGLMEEITADQPLLVRGNHKNPGDPVQRRYLEALNGKPYDDPRKVRLRLADEVASPRNPLTARVMVNRIWHYVFGRGIVETVDNFGKQGRRPTHPALLDYLAGRFVDSGWSIKDAIRFVASSRTYQMSSRPSKTARRIDPSNRWLQHANVRRLGAEAIRDSILAVSWSLDTTMYGPSIPVYYARETGKALLDRPKGPLDGNGRRSVYLEVRRNIHNPFLEVFDAPKPSTTRGKRDITNVPAQSLTLMNDPFVIEQSAHWAKRLVAQGRASSRERIGRMFLEALGRRPSAVEVRKSKRFLASLRKQHQLAARDWRNQPRIWQDLAQAMFNFKEFIYLQ